MPAFIFIPLLTMAAITNKRSQVSIDQQIKILDAVDKKTKSKSEIARIFNVPKSTLFTIIKNREAICQVSDAGVSRSRIRAREGKFPMLEKALLEWLKLMRSQNVPIDGNFLKSKAQTFAEKMHIEDSFKASNGWIQKFKDRHGLSFKKLCGESASVNPDTVKGWKSELKRFVFDYDPKDIFNADETGLYFKLLPDRSVVLKGENAHGGKRSKQRITVLLAANMNGTEKLPVLIIGNSANPRCFKGIKTLPTTYKNNKKAWMTSVIFEEWLRSLDRKMASKKRKILLIIDNCTAHPVIRGLKAIKVEFLPPNATSVLQPLDQGVIQSYKKQYRKMLIRRVIDALEKGNTYEVNILTAMHLSNAAWDTVTEQTIKNCFRHAGFKTKDEFDEEIVPPVTDAPSESADVTTQLINNEAASQLIDKDAEEMMQIIQVQRGVLADVTFEEYVQIDKDLQCCEDLIGEDEFIARITGEDDIGVKSASDDEDSVEISTTAPTTRSATEAVGILRRFFEREDGTEEYLRTITDMENYILQSAQKRSKQTSIVDFFKR